MIYFIQEKATNNYQITICFYVPCLGSKDIRTQMFCEDCLHRVTFNKQKAMCLHNPFTQTQTQLLHVMNINQMQSQSQFSDSNV